MQDDATDMDWSSYLRAFRKANGMSQRELGEKCDLSVFAIRRFEQGEMPKHQEADKIRKYIESLPVADNRLPLPRHGIDEVSAVLLPRIKKHYSELNRKDGLCKNILTRLVDDDPEMLDEFTEYLLRRYALSFRDLETRHDRLLELLKNGA